MNSATPPPWAERLLRLLLPPDQREAVSGDLLEEYRESIHPVRGQQRADLWYVKQVLGFAWRDNRLWGVLFGASFVARTALDWLVPPTSFHLRSTVSTVVGIGIPLLAGSASSWRAGSLRAGTLAGLTTTSIAAVISLIGAGLLLAIWHDSQTLIAIQGSGGLEEVFTLPVMMIFAGAFLGALGGVFGRLARTITRGVA